MTATLRTDFDAFLFAPIGEDTNGMPLTLLSVLARLGIDPWEEAADLAHLPLEPALQRLSSRLEAMPAWAAGNRRRHGEHRHAPDCAAASCSGAEGIDAGSTLRH